MKTCTRCKTQKPKSEFFNDKSTNDGKCPSCKSCVYMRRKHPTKILNLPIGHKQCNGCKAIKPVDEFWADKNNKTDGKYSHCKDCKTASTYKWRENNQETYNQSMRDYQAARPLQRDDCDLKRKYGVSRKWFEETLELQAHKCAICKNPNTSSKRRFAVDHDHETGQVRGLLCYKCNRDMHVIDDTEHLERLLQYKNKHK